MAQDPRRFDQIEKVVSDTRRKLDDQTSTIQARLAGHTHSEDQITSLVTDLSGKAPTSHTHAPTDVTSAVLHETRVTLTSAHSIPNITDQLLFFNNTVYGSADVTVYGGGSGFTLNRSGLWIVTTACRTAAAAGGGERHIVIQTGSVFNFADRVSQMAVTNVGNAPVTVCTSTAVRITAPTDIMIFMWQNSGGSINIDTGFGGTNHATFTWLRP